MQLHTGLVTTRLPDTPAAAKAAEELGYDAIWTAETGHDPYLPLVLAAEHTQRIKLGTSIAVSFARSPMTHAMIAWDLQALSRGRFLLGLGTQVKAHNERRFGVKWESPGPRLREMILMIREAWNTFQTGKPPKFVGKYYNLTLMTPFFTGGPIDQPAPPIYIAGVNEYMCRLAGELCDGFHAHPFHSIKYLKEVVQPKIGEGAAKAGREPRDCKISTTAFVVAGETKSEIEAAKAPVKQQIAFYASTPAYAAVLECHGWGDVSRRLTDLSKQGKWVEMADLITDEMLAVYAVIGSWDEVPDMLRAKYEGVLDRVGFYHGFTGEKGRARQEKIIRSFNG